MGNPRKRKKARILELIKNMQENKPILEVKELEKTVSEVTPDPVEIVESKKEEVVEEVKISRKKKNV